MKRSHSEFGDAQRPLLDSEFPDTAVSGGAQRRPEILHINISPGGVPKRAIPEGIVTIEGIRGDSCAHPAIHGGPRQAVLIITAEGLGELIAQGFPLYPGALGENLTTQGLDRRQMRVGQRYRIGEVFLEITKLRGPCTTLDVYGPGIQRAVYDAQVKSGDASSPRWGLGGFYAQVLKPGVIRPHDIITLVDQAV
ncbi:MAG TPA: MOSC domain-containing protein [Bryobacteraceae bacterium]|nr:MOSC domain-containing protein [Bryobacteraceae bacterium]